MALILDTGIVYACYDRGDAWHVRAKEVMCGAAAAGLLLPSPILPEVDQLVRQRLGVEACRMFYAGLLDGSYIVADVPREQYARIVELNRQYPDIGFVDASVVAIAESRRVIASTNRFVFGEYRRHMKTITYLGRIDKLFGVPATTRNWNTIAAIVRILKDRSKKGR